MKLPVYSIRLSVFLIAVLFLFTNCKNDEPIEPASNESGINPFNAREGSKDALVSEEVNIDDLLGNVYALIPDTTDIYAVPSTGMPNDLYSFGHSPAVIRFSNKLIGDGFSNYTLFPGYYTFEKGFDYYQYDYMKPNENNNGSVWEQRFHLYRVEESNVASLWVNEYDDLYLVDFGRNRKWWQFGGGFGETPTYPNYKYGARMDFRSVPPDRLMTISILYNQFTNETIYADTALYYHITE